jgi:hypothetical protein
MADPTYYVGSAINRAIEARINGKPYPISSATLSLWDPGGVNHLNAVSMTIAGTRATYQIAGSQIDAVGTASTPWKVEYAVTFANSQGLLHFQETLIVKARYP